MKEEKSICQECGRELPLEEFACNRWGYTNTCKDCMMTKKWTALGSTPDEVLVEELRSRGWSGELTKKYTLMV